MMPYPLVTGPDPQTDATLAALLDALYARHNQAICCTLVYGSCLRSGNIYDGLLDLYLICDDYRTAYGPGLLAGANWLMPPNVFYAQQTAPLTEPPAQVHTERSERDTEPHAQRHAGQSAETGGGAQGTNAQTLRAKVTVISLRDFERGCSSAWFESYIWGRFAQPTLILNPRSDLLRKRIERALYQAANTLLHNALPVLPQQGSITSLWERALGLSYATELRTERSGRAAELADAAATFYVQMTAQLASRLGYGFALSADGQAYVSAPSALATRRAGLAWGLRRGQGKLLSITRLVKALFTFEGGLDYIAWKLTRHSGQQITIPDNVRRAPLIHLWGFFWGLYRQGIFK